MSSFYTKMPTGLFLYEFIPYFEDPKHLVVLRCINREHASVFMSRIEPFFKHYKPFLEESKERMNKLEEENGI
jgi:hypothetical protein